MVAFSCICSLCGYARNYEIGLLQGMHLHLQFKCYALDYLNCERGFLYRVAFSYFVVQKVGDVNM